MDTYPILQQHPHGPSKHGWGLAAIIASIIAIILLNSCTPKYTPILAARDVMKAYNAHPDTVAHITRGLFPCITKATDTVLTTKDSVVYIDCPDLPTIVHEPGNTDTVYQQQVRTVKVPVHLPIQIQRITTYIEDSAKIMVMADQLQKASTNYTILQTKFEDRTSQRDWWRKIALILAGLIVAYIGLRIFTKIPFIK